MEQASVVPDNHWTTVPYSMMTTATGHLDRRWCMPKGLTTWCTHVHRTMHT